jgi:hypothetical protein
VGLPFLLKRFLIWAPGILVTSVCVGTLIGVLFIGRSIAAPTATGMGVLLAYAGLVPLQELLVAQGNGATRTGHLTLLSPAVPLKNALRFALVAPSIPTTTTFTWIALFLVAGGALALAIWVFLHAQGVETWETTSGEKLTITAAIVAIALVPVILGDTDYDAPAPRANNAPAVRALFSRVGSNLGLTPPGGQLPDRCCSTILNRDEWPPLGTDTRTKRDLFILLPVDASQRVTDLHIQIEGDDGLVATADPNALAGSAQYLETRTYGSDLGPAAADGHRVTTGWVARVPVTLNPTKPWDVGGDRYPLNVAATYQIEGDHQLRTLSARGAIDAQISSAIYEMGAASAFLPLMCLMVAVTRWWRTR